MLATHRNGKAVGLKGSEGRDGFGQFMESGSEVSARRSPSEDFSL